MVPTLEERTEQEIPKLSRSENLLNFARHLPLLYIPASAIAKPILLYGQNPVDYYVEQGPAGLAMAATGFALAAAGAFMKQTNDESELQTICANVHEDENNQEMVETGMYEHTRHPCYFAQTLMAAGFSMISPAIDTGIALASYLGLTQYCAKAEEKKNLAQFGERYKNYMSKVPRWPKISKIGKLFSSGLSALSGTNEKDVSENRQSL
jgi:protein-S-isoprenylcysteine O-methyltransferase Ste14